VTERGYDLMPPGLAPPGLVLIERWQLDRIRDLPGAERFPMWAGLARAR
jgi:hypothetical protein